MFDWCRRGRWALLLALGLASLACTHNSRPTTTVPEVAAPEDRVGIDDTFDVRVYGEVDLSGMFRVATDGTVDYPLAGRLQVAGLRTGEIQHLIVEKLKDRYLKDPQVIVTIKDRNSQKITVLGQVVKPGQVGYYPNMTIVDAIASLSFLTHFASISKGVIDFRDLVYFGLMIGFWLYANAVVIDLKKAD